MGGVRCCDFCSSLGKGCRSAVLGKGVVHWATMQERIMRDSLRACERINRADLSKCKFRHSGADTTH